MPDPWTSDGEELSAWSVVLFVLCVLGVFGALVSAGVFFSWWFLG